MANLPRRTLAVDSSVSDQETVVYTLQNHQAHCLQGLAQDVYRLCDGMITVAQAAEQLNVSVEEVEGVLESLFESGLTMYPEAAADQGETLSRRKFVAGATAAAGLVLSLGLPVAAAAASCVPSTGCSFGNSGTPCDEGGGLCTNNCMNCYSYSGLDTNNQPIPNGNNCRFVINIAACLQYGSSPDYQQSCSTSFFNRGIDQAWCCSPSPAGSWFQENVANGGNAAPIANGGGACTT